MGLFIGVCSNCKKDYYYSASKIDAFLNPPCTNCGSKSPLIIWKKLNVPAENHRNVIRKKIIEILICLLGFTLVNILDTRINLGLYIILAIYLYIIIVTLYQYLTYPYFKYLCEYQIDLCIKRMGISSNEYYSKLVKNHLKKLLRL